MHRHPITLAEVVRRYKADGADEEGNFAVLLDEFLDVFYSEPAAAQRQAMLDEEPPRIGSERLDAYVGAVGEHLARRWDLMVPRWSAQTFREVAEPWFVGMMGQGLSGLLLVESPIAFRRRRIFTEAEPLRRARMPARDPHEVRPGDPSAQQQP
jgi:hypothetical protein